MFSKKEKQQWSKTILINFFVYLPVWQLHEKHYEEWRDDLTENLSMTVEKMHTHNHLHYYKSSSIVHSMLTNLIKMECKFE